MQSGELEIWKLNVKRETVSVYACETFNFELMLILGNIG